jgi:hypothetical protein
VRVKAAAPQRLDRAFEPIRIGRLGEFVVEWAGVWQDEAHGTLFLWRGGTWNVSVPPFVCKK